MVELVAVIVGSGALAALVSWMAGRGRDRAEVTAIDVATTSQLATEFIAANRALVTAEHRADRIGRNLADISLVVDRLADQLGDDNPDVLRLRRLIAEATPPTAL